MAATVPGIPLGLLLKGLYENAGKIILALVIIGFSLYCLFRPKLFALRHEWAAYPFGFLAGILGGAYNSNGPPVVIYGTLRRWPPDCFRASLQGPGFALTHLGIIDFVDRQAHPDMRATYLSIRNVARMSVASSLGGILGSWLIERWGSAFLMQFCGWGSIFLAFFFTSLVRRHGRQGGGGSGD